jgi:sodium-dependent dicarboxylate transporter 2/3/5
MMTRKQSVFLYSAGLMATALWFLLTLWAGQTQAVAWTASITLLTAILWVTEAIPIPAASLIPFALFPFSGVLSHKEVA